MKKKILKNGSVVSDGIIQECDLLIVNDRIEQIGGIIDCSNAEELDCTGLHILPGVIDGHVHFREPGLTHKGTIYSESRAALMGGVTSFIDMPNTLPHTISVERLREKYSIAEQSSWINYGFLLGISADNYKDLVNADFEGLLGLTDDGLYFENANSLLCDREDVLDYVLANSNHLLAIHSEDSATINDNIEKYKRAFGNEIPFDAHGKIRSAEACYKSTKTAVDIARKHNARLHILHLTSGAECELFDKGEDILKKRITTEVCPQNLWFNESDYARLGSKIKWNPSIKTEKDRRSLLLALNNDQIDMVVTDHAPHLKKEKDGDYLNAISGAPMIQHSLQVMLELYHRGEIKLERLVTKLCHNPALLYGIESRGFLREGYYADIVCVDLNKSYLVSSSNLASQCKWSPLEGQEFHSSVIHTFVNGSWSLKNQSIQNERKVHPLVRKN
jgi:dihydroorotase